MGIGHSGKRFLRKTYVRAFEPAADESAFLEVEIAVFNVGGADPIFKDPFLSAETVLRVGDVHGIRRTPGFQYLFPSHSEQNAMLLDVFLKRRVEPLGNEACREHDDKEQHKAGVNDDPDRALTDKGRGFKGIGDWWGRVATRPRL